MTSRCECHQCIDDFNMKGPVSGVLFVDDMPLSARKMILCVTCGNKRCPKASDHRLRCTNSNDVGQSGSIYE